MGGHVGHFGPGVFRLMSMGANVLHQRVHAGLAEVHTVADHVSAFSVAGRRIFQRLAGVEEGVSLFPGQFQQRLVEAVDGLHADVGVIPLFCHRGNSIDDDVRIGIGLVDGIQRLFILLGEHIRGPAGVVGAESDDDALRLQHFHCFGNQHQRRIARELLGGGAGHILNAHAGHAQVVLPGGSAVNHHALGVGIADEQGVVNVGLSRVLGFGQNGAVVLFHVQGIGGHVIALADGAAAGCTGLRFFAQTRNGQNEHGHQHHYQKTDHRQNRDVQGASIPHTAEKALQGLSGFPEKFLDLIQSVLLPQAAGA